MRKLRTMAILVLTCGPAALAQRGVPAPAAGSIISTTDLTFDGGGFAHETFTLSGPAQGDWYVTATDAHTTLTLTSPAGPLSFTYGYDDADNSVSMKDAAGTHTYAYNRRDYLTSATHPTATNPAETLPLSRRDAFQLIAADPRRRTKKIGARM